MTSLITVLLTQPSLRFMQTVRLFDSQQAKCLTSNDFFDEIPHCDGKQRTISDEIAAYKRAVTEVAADVKPMTFWFSNRERFPNLCELAMRYLSAHVILSTVKEVLVSTILSTHRSVRAFLMTVWHFML